MSSTLETVSAVMAESQLAAAVSAVSGTATSRLLGDEARELTVEEVDRLRSEGWLFAGEEFQVVLEQLLAVLFDPQCEVLELEVGIASLDQKGNHGVGW